MTPAIIAVSVHGLGNPSSGPRAARVNHWRRRNGAAAPTSSPSVAWTYRDPTPAYEALRDHVAFYPGRVDVTWIGDERVQAQASDYYGGWITADLVGPFKGPPETLGW